MIRGNLLKKSLSLVMAIAILVGVASPAASAVGALREDTYDLVALGDGTTAGVGLNNPSTETYLKWIDNLRDDISGTVSKGNASYRMEELRVLLADSDAEKPYAGDGYTAAKFTGLTFDRANVQDWVSNAKKVIIQAGVSNFSTYIVEQLMYYMDNGEAKYAYDLSRFDETLKTETIENVKTQVMTLFKSAAPDSMHSILDAIDFVTEVFVYSYLSYMESFNEVVERIYELNPDVDLYVVGIYNPASSNEFVLEKDGKSYNLHLNDAMEAMVELANIYTQILAHREYGYTYVDPGAPELHIDDLGNGNLTNAMKRALVESMEDQIAREIQAMLDHYGVTPKDEYGDPMSALEIVYELIDLETVGERKEYIISILGDSVTDDFVSNGDIQEELNKVFGAAAGSNIEIVMPNNNATGDGFDLNVLLKDLEAEATREVEARKFIVSVFRATLNKMAVDETPVFGYTFTEKQANQAIDLLEDSTTADELKRNAAELMLTESGLTDEQKADLGIDVQAIVDLLTALESKTTPDAREAYIEEWYNRKIVEHGAPTVRDKAVEKLVDDLGMSPNEAEAAYTLEMAQAMLNAVITADNQELTVQKYLIKDFVVIAMNAKGLELYQYTDANGDGKEDRFGDLNLTYFVDDPNTTDRDEGVEAFQNAILNAANKDAAVAIAAMQLRMAGAVYADQMCEDTSGLPALWTDLTAGQVYEWFFELEQIDKNPPARPSDYNDAQYATYIEEYKYNYILESVATLRGYPTSNTVWVEYIGGPITDYIIEGYNKYAEAIDVFDNLDGYTEDISGFTSITDDIAEGYDLYALLRDDIFPKYTDAVNGAVDALVDAYETYMNSTDMEDIDDYLEAIDNTFAQLKTIAKHHTISLNDLFDLAGELSIGGMGYISSVIDKVTKNTPLSEGEMSAAYLALRYVLAGHVMIYPSANGQEYLAKRINAAMNGEQVNSSFGEVGNKIVDGTMALYKFTKDYLKLPVSGSGQIEPLKNPNSYVALGDNITSGSALTAGDKTYAQLIGDALAMDFEHDNAIYDGDLVGNYAINGMRAEELLAILTNYEGDEYTADRFGANAVQAWRDAYLADIKNAELITINVGINNLTTYPLTQTLLAWNGEETYEMDWGRYIGETRANKLSSGKNAVTSLMMRLVDSAENRSETLEGLSTYERCERALNTVTTAVESMMYGMLSYVMNMNQAVEAVAELNRDATIVLVGFYNPLKDTYIEIEKSFDVKGHTVDLSEYPINVSAITDKLIKQANRWLTNYCGGETASDAGSRIVVVPVNNTETFISGNTEVSKDLSKLADYTITFKGITKDIKVPQYLLEVGSTAGEALHPNAAGHQYIADRILAALDFEIYADIVIGEYEKVYGQADPEFTYAIDDLSSLYPIQGTAGRHQDYLLTEAAGSRIPLVFNGTWDNGYAEVEVMEGSLTINKRPANITLHVVNGVGTLTVESEDQENARGILATELTALNVGYTVDANGDYVVTYDETVVSNYDLDIVVTVEVTGVAMIERVDGTVYYQDLLSAVNDAQDGEWITLLADITEEPAGLVLDKCVKIDTNGHTIWTNDLEPYADDDHYTELDNGVWAVYEKIDVTIDVTLDKDSIYVGESIPGVNVTVNGVLPGDDLNVAPNTNNVNVNAAGRYEITATWTENKMYKVTVNPATLSVLSKNDVVIKVTLDQESIYVGESIPGANVTVSGLVDGDDLNVVVDTSAVNVNAAGQYEIGVNYTENTKYNV